MFPPRRLNPFLIRALVLSHTLEGGAVQLRLNPFLIRALVLRYPFVAFDLVESLNPFLIRALVLRGGNVGIGTTTPVLIPS